MTAWVVLFRGVGGATQLPVARLREGLEAEGFGRVATYINSGNAVLTSPLPREGVAEGVRRAVAPLGFAKDVHLLTRAEWAEVAEANPFGDVPGNTLHAAVLAAEPAPARVAALRALAEAGSPDRFEVRGRVAYILTPDGLSRSKLGARFDKGIGVPNTARNWNTVLRLLAMAEAAERADGA